MTPLLFIVDWQERPIDTNHWTVEPMPRDGERVIGIQTMIAGPDRGPMIQGGISSPFLACCPRCGSKTTWHTLDCPCRTQAPNSSPGRETRDHSTNTFPA